MTLSLSWHNARSVVSCWCEAAHACSGREGKYFYYSKTLEGEQYRVSCRRRMPPGMGPPTGLIVHNECASQSDVEV